MNYQEALEFIGEARAGISWERLCTGAVRYSQVLIDLMGGAEEARAFLNSKGIGSEYVTANIMNIFQRLHCNREEDYYLSLALPRSASGVQIQKRWKELMLLYHPDRNSSKDAAECAARINEAYNVLKNPEKKNAYDRKILARGDVLSPLREVKTFRSPAPTHSDGPSRLRSILPRLIIPFCLLISLVTLLIIFVENRTIPDVYHGYPPESGSGDAPQEKKQLPERTAMQLGLIGETQSDQATRNRGESGEGLREKREKTVPTQVPDRARPQAGKTGGKKADILEEKRETFIAEPGVSAGLKERQETGERYEGEKAAAGLKGLALPVIAPEKTQEPRVEKPAAQGLQSLQAAVKSDPDALERSVNLFISRYTRAYEEGDVEKFMSLYSKSGIENSRLNYDDIRRAYRKNFESARYRYALTNVQFRKNGENIAVTASYTIRRQGEKGEEITIQGDIRWILAREEGSLKIVKADYERR